MRCWKCQKHGHVEIICKEIGQQNKGQAQVANQHKKEQLFVPSSFASSISIKCLLVDSGYTNHTTSDEKHLKGSIEQHHQESGLEIENTSLQKDRGLCLLRVLQVQNLFLKFCLFLKLTRIYLVLHNYLKMGSNYF